MDAFKGWERCWGPERDFARTALSVEVDLLGGGIRAGIQPLRWGIGASLHISDDTRMVYLTIGPFHAHAHITNNSPEAVEARRQRQEKSFALVRRLLDERNGETP